MARFTGEDRDPVLSSNADAGAAARPGLGANPWEWVNWRPTGPCRNSSAITNAIALALAVDPAPVLFTTPTCLLPLTPLLLLPAPALALVPVPESHVTPSPCLGPRDVSE